MKHSHGFAVLWVLAVGWGVGCSAGPGPEAPPRTVDGATPSSQTGDAGAGCPGSSPCDGPPAEAAPALDTGCEGAACPLPPDAGGTAPGCQSNAECPSRACEAGSCRPLSEDRPLRAAPGCLGEEGAARAVFEIPRPGEVSTDFFRLPFPSDVRIADGRLDLSELPRPGSGLFGFDLVDRYAKAITEDAVGFGLNPAVTFRFTRPLGTAGAAGTVDAQAIHFVDLTPGPGLDEAIPFEVAVAPAGRYLCAHGLLVRPAAWRPLRPKHTYAVVLTAALRDQQGAPFSADPDFLWMLAETAPRDAALLAAWTTHAPLRAWVRRMGLAPSTLLSAALFTTEDAPRIAEGLFARVASEPVPALKALVRCGAGQGSACDDARTVGCATAPEAAAFDEYRGQIEIPVFQEGTPPYETEGGAFRFGPQGPEVVRRESVCFSLTVPKGPAPVGGWPVVVYAHGTGGHHRGHVESGLAEEYATGALSSGVPAPMAMLGYDGVLHGPRRGISDRGVEELVYNFLNPRAARSNNLQAAADLFAIARVMPGFAARGLSLDSSRLGLYGHSQGGNAAAVAAAFESRYAAVTLTGTGGGLSRTLLEKTKPVAVNQLLPLFLADPVFGPSHPVLALLQLYFDAADPLTFARHIVVEPQAMAEPHHLLHVYGSQDNFSPDPTQRFFAQAAGLPVLRPVVATELLADFVIIAGPVLQNLQVGNRTVTAVQMQASPDGFDGHFVGTRDAAARTAIQRFFGSYFRDGAPVVE